MNSPKSETLPSIHQPWPHFDGSPGEIVISERDFITGDYTFGASNKCRITLEFTGLVIPGLTGTPGDRSMYLNGSQWLQCFFPNADNIDNVTNVFWIGSGYFDFDPGSGQPTTGWGYSPRTAGPASNCNWSEFGDISDETFTLQVSFDRTDIHADVTIDFRSTNIVLCDNLHYNSGQPDDVQMPASFTVYTGSRLVEAVNPYGAYGHKITKFCCEDIA